MHEHYKNNSHVIKLLDILEKCQAHLGKWG